MSAAVLVVFGGLPGTGKTTLSRAVAEALGAVWLRIDAIEAAILRYRRPGRSRWRQVLDGEYEPWTEPRLTVDTAAKNGGQVRRILDCVGRRRRAGSGRRKPPAGRANPIAST
jgi:adenylate kinase family enzyme